MKRKDINVLRREKTGKGAARSTRRAGRVPGVIYGGNEESVAISVDLHDMELAFHGVEGENLLVNLQLEGGDQGEHLAIIRDTQHHPLTGTLRHLDFLRVFRDVAIRSYVPVHPVGNAKGVKEGGLFEQILREVEVECLPLDFPDLLEVDVTELDTGMTIHVSDLPENPKYTILTEGERALFTVVAPKLETKAAAEDEEAEGAEGEAAEGEAGAAEGE